MNIPAWATHLITFESTEKVTAVVAVREGGYQYLKKNGDGGLEQYRDHVWGLEDWKLALRHERYKCVIEDLANFTLENE